MSTTPPQLWVVFSGETEIWWLRLFLKRHFRHCYVLINDGVKWITYDPLAHKTEIAVHHDTLATFDLPQWLKSRGLKVVKVKSRTPLQHPLKPSFFTCVEAVKRVIGMQKWFIMTPYQLYRALISHSS